MSRLLLVAHGTASPTGLATIEAIRYAVASARPGVDVALCYLDVARPHLPEALASMDGPLVVVPLLLSTGYHVQSDIPAAVAGRPDVALARHLGPHPLLADALADRLGDVGTDARSVVLVGSGSSRPDAAVELASAARLLSARLRVDVPVQTMAGDLRAALAGLPGPLSIATYLLAEGRFTEVLADAADGVARVAAPIGAHPALTRLVWARYDQAIGVRTDGVGGTVR